jgi:RND family efflux transporter MFP subunit
MKSIPVKKRNHEGKIPLKHSFTLSFLHSFTSFFFLFFVLFSCSSGKEHPAAQGSQDSTIKVDEKQKVSAMLLKYSDFNKEIISNGKLAALNKADLKFRTSENVAAVLVRNGDRVRTGQVIAKLENFTLVNTLKQSRDQFEKAKLDLQDVLIGQGYSLNDTAKIPGAILKTAKIKSGYDRALTDYEMADYNLSASVLKAPFDGVVANLFSKAANMAAIADKFCTVIDDSRFEAEFPVLESELGSVHTGQTVRIIPFSYDDVEVNGEITKINPMVDQNGMVKISAVCNNNTRKLFEGMNVKVVIEEKVPHQLVIPKQAVVLRSEKQVVFTLQSGKAKWNYVKTGLENISSFSVNEGLKAGDSVIYDGNLNLAHDAEVQIMKELKNENNEGIKNKR